MTSDRCASNQEQGKTRFAKPVSDVSIRESNPGGQPSIAQQLNSLFKKLKGGADDFYAKLHTLESCIIEEEGKSSTLFAEVEQYPCSERGNTIQIDLVVLLGELPGYMMPMLALFDPSSIVQNRHYESYHSSGDAGHSCKDASDLFAGNASTVLQELYRCAELCNILSIIVADGPEVKRAPSSGTDWVILQARAVSCSMSSQAAGGGQALLQSVMELLNVFLCKSLGPSTSGALHALLGSDSSTVFSRGVDWMRIAVHLFHCVDRVAFLTTVVRRKPGCAEQLHHESQGLAMEAVAAVRPLTRPLLIRMFRYLRTCFEIVREKVVSDLAVEPQDSKAEAKLAVATDGTRAVAYQLAMAHEVMERWIQAAPMHALLLQPRLPTYSTEGEAHAARGDADDDDATVDPTTDCIVSAVLEMAFAGVALLLPEADAKGRRIFSLAYEDPPARECRLSLVPTAVVDGDVELLVSRSLLVFYMATSALRPLLTEGRVGVDWESRIGAWYLPFTACAYCAMSFAEDVLQRRWAVTFGEPPRPRQEHEGQLTINALRATAMLLATHGAVFCDPNPPEIFDKLHDAYQGLLSSMRTALLTPPETVAAAFGAGCIAQALYSDRGAVNIAPVDCYDPETGALVCLAGVNLADILREEIAAADLIDTASGRRRSAAAKARVPDAQLPALLQAKEVSLRVWQIIWSLVAFSMQGPGGKPLQDGLSQSALAQVLKASVERAMCARPPAEVWQQLPARMLTNIKCIATSAAATEMQARGSRGPSRVQQEHRDVVAFILRFFQALREKMEREAMAARYSRAAAQAAVSSYPPPATMTPQTLQCSSGAGGVGYMHGGYPYPQMMSVGDPRAMMYPSMPGMHMNAQPRLSAGVAGVPSVGVELRQGRRPDTSDRDRDVRQQDADTREADMRSRSRDSPAADVRRTTAAPARATGIGLKGCDVPVSGSDAFAGPPSSRRSTDDRREEAPRSAEGVADGQMKAQNQHRHSSGCEHDARQVSAQTAPFAFASSYPDLMPPQPTANPMFAQAPQGYYMAPLNSAPAVDVATGMPLGPAFGTAVAGNPLLHPGAAEPHAPVNKPHPLSQDTAPPRQMSAGASQDAMLRPVRKQSCDLGSEDNQNHHNNS